MVTFNNKASQGLRVLMMVMLVGALVATSGCSWFRKKKAEAAPAPAAAEVTPPQSNQEGHAPGTTVEFPAEAGIKDIHFDFDKANIRADQVEILDNNIKYFMAHPEAKIYVEGHTDERGTVEYNFALGQRRSTAVSDYLAKHGVTADRLATASKGEEEPLDPAHAEKAWAQNRRVHFKRLY